MSIRGCLGRKKRGLDLVALFCFPFFFFVEKVSLSLSILTTVGRTKVGNRELTFLYTPGLASIQLSLKPLCILT